MNNAERQLPFASANGLKPIGSPIAAMCVWLIIGICCIAPLAWMATQIAIHPAVLRDLRPTSFRMALLGRTLLYNGAAAAIACLISIPAAVVIGRGRGWIASLLLLTLPVALAMPSVAYTYGWLQFFRLIGVSFVPADAADVMRCIWTLACWLWPVPAIAVGLSLRHLDTQIQQQAMLDGALWRVTARMLLGPMLASGAVVLVLAMQEFSVYERSGISVIATEVRTIFETGMGSQNNPTTISGVVAGGGLGDPNQAARAAAALAAGLPMLLIVAILVIAALAYAMRLSSADRVDPGPWPKVLSAGWIWVAGAVFILLIALAIPTAAMVLSISPTRWAADSAGHAFPVRIWLWASPYIEGTLLYGVLAAGVALVLAKLSAVRRGRWMLVIAMAAFLIGGELLAIAHIRLFNRTLPPALARLGGQRLITSIYNNAPMAVIAYVGRFGWLALLAGNLTWTRPYRELRDMAAVDGAGPWRISTSVVMPIAWPILLASAAAVMALAMTEVSATILLAPARPQTLIVTLMSWVHMLRYDDMLEGCLLLMAMVLVLSIACVILIRLGVRFASRLDRPMRIAAVLMVAAMLFGCDDHSKPQAIWCETGTGPGQLVYPRGIAYSRRDGCFFVVDRTARIQRLDNKGNYVLEWSMPESRQGKPVGLAVGPDGNVYVADTHYSRVMIYSPDGKFLRQIGTHGRGLGQFIYPTDVAFDSAGNIYVSEYGDNDRIQVFDPTGSRVIRVIGRFGQRDGEFSRPEAMVIDGDRLYVTDSSNHRIVVFRTDGTFVKNIGSIGGGLGEFRFPYGLTMDSDGRLIVTEYGNNRVQLVDKETGRGLKTWGVPGREPGQLAYPWASAIDKRGRVVTVDSGNNRLQVFQW